MDMVWASLVSILYLVCLLLLVVGGYAVYRNKIKHAHKISALPEAIGTIDFSYCMKYGTDSDTAASLIYEWAVQGHVSLVQHRDGGFTVYRRKPLEKTHSDYEQMIYRVLFESGNGENSVHSSRMALVCKEISGLIRKAVKEGQKNAQPKWRYYIAPACWILACLFAVGCIVWLGAERNTMFNMQFQAVEIEKSSLNGYLTAILSAWPSLLIYSACAIVFLYFIRRITFWMRPKWADAKKKTRLGSILVGLLSTLAFMAGIAALCYGLFVDVPTGATWAGTVGMLSCSGLLCMMSALIPPSDSPAFPIEEIYGFYRYLMETDSKQLEEGFKRDSEQFSYYLAYAVSVGGEDSLLQRCREIEVDMPSWLSVDVASELSQEKLLTLLGGQIAYLKACFRLKQPSEDIVNHKTPVWGENKEK